MMKKILAGVALSSLSIAAFATNLTIDNHTNMYTTALVKGFCAGSLQVYTDPGKTGDTINWLTVQTLCAYSENCEADVYVLPSKDCSADTLTKGVKIATATLNSKNGTITPATASNGGYTMSTEGRAYYMNFSGGALSK